MPASPASFALGPRPDLAALTRRFARDGRVRIDGFLAQPAAAALRAHLAAREDWVTLVGDDRRVFEIDGATRRGFDARRAAALDEAVFAAAREGFQFRFDSIRVPDDAGTRRAAPSTLTDFADWMSSDEVVALLRAVTGADAIAFADAQATRYRAGDFLTGHDDEVAGKGRRAAYVFGLTTRWRLEWGGLLTYHDGADRFSGTVPGFNTLDLFRVPQPHSVSLVSAAAGGDRVAVTGWLRAGTAA